MKGYKMQIVVTDASGISTIVDSETVSSIEEYKKRLEYAKNVLENAAEYAKIILFTETSLIWHTGTKNETRQYILVNK